MTEDSEKWPYYPWYPRDFLADTLLLTETEELMYRRLLDYQWLQGAVPSDVTELAAAARLPRSRAAKAWARIEAYFPAWEDGVRRNRRLERERNALIEKQAKRSKSGKSGAAKRWQRDGNAIEVPMLIDGIPEPYPEAEPERTTTTAREAFVALVPAEYRPDVEAAIRASSRPDALVASLRMIVEGGEAVAYDHATIGQALREIAVAGRPITVNTIRAYCRNVGGRVSRETARADAETPGERVLRLAAEQDAAA